MKKVGIATVYTGYNYGSALQAYAVKQILENIGYESELLGVRGSLIPGRDVRLKKLVVIATRSLLHFKNLRNNFDIYRNSISKSMSDKSIELFKNFTRQYLNPQLYSYTQLKEIGKSKDYNAFVCGSDQIWNSSTFYVDPLYYLKFAPSIKRIAFSPSFGRDYIPAYNKKRIAKNIAEFSSISVREDSGAEIVQALIGKTPPVLMDPTLVLTAEQWTEQLQIDNVESQEDYILSYFLNKPNAKALDFMNEAASTTGLKIITLPFPISYINALTECRDAGPRDFVSLVKGAKMVCTDSFHGTAFSLNYNIPFYTYERNYGNAENQCTRILSLLNKTNLQDRYENVRFHDWYDIDFSGANAVLHKERQKALNYLRNAIMEVENAAK